MKKLMNDIQHLITSDAEKSTKNRYTKKGFLRISFCLVFLLISSGCSSEFWNGPKCIKISKVISIDSIIHRGGFVTLENGDKIDVGQPAYPILIGSDICVEWFFKGKTIKRK